MQPRSYSATITSRKKQMLKSNRRRTAETKEKEKQMTIAVNNGVNHQSHIKKIIRGSNKERGRVERENRE